MTLPGRVLLATRSAGKLRELRAIFDEAGIQVIDLDEAGIPESESEEELERHATFAENAVAKARHFNGVSGVPTFADDSGLEVLALGGAPGVRSKRWSGRADLSGTALDAVNNALLLSTLAPHEDRRARYVCVAAFVDGERAIASRGEVSGRILAGARGTGGFGYDPLFESTELGRTFAEMDLEAKGSVSHRGRAFRALLQELRRGR